MEEGTEGQTIVPGGAEVGDFHIPVPDQLILTPLEQCIPFGASVYDQRVQRVLSFTWSEEREEKGISKLFE